MMLIRYASHVCSPVGSAFDLQSFAQGSILLGVISSSSIYPLVNTAD